MTDINEADIEQLQARLNYLRIQASKQGEIARAERALAPSPSLYSRTIVFRAKDRPNHDRGDSKGREYVAHINFDTHPDLYEDLRAAILKVLEAHKDAT